MGGVSLTGVYIFNLPPTDIPPNLGREIMKKEKKKKRPESSLNCIFPLFVFALVEKNTEKFRKKSINK